MISCPNYNKATNVAYEILSQRQSTNLFTDVFSIIENFLSKDCRLFTYGQAVFFYGMSREDLMAESEYGFSVLDGKGHRIIFFNETLPLSVVRFTLAHEIGHAILGHTNEDDPGAEKEANCFARNLLCPIPIVYGLNLCCVSDYENLFDVSSKMASVAFEYRERDKYYISNTNWMAITEMLDAFMAGFDTIEAYNQYMVS